MPSTSPESTRRAECTRCLRPQRTCVCGFAACIESQLELLILQHPHEVREAKGTARLLHLSVPGSSLLVGEAFDPEELHVALFGGGRTPVLLYPPTGDDTCVRYTPGTQAPDSVRLVILDGTWRKSRKMLFCNPVLQALPRLALEDVPPSAYRIRKSHAPHQLSTLEAAACAMSALDPAADTGRMLDGFAMFIDRQAALAGR